MKLIPRKCFSEREIPLFRPNSKQNISKVASKRQINNVSSLLKELKAKMAFKTIGKKQTKTTIITLGNKPNPNQEINKGAKAILGVISILTKKG